MLLQIAPWSFDVLSATYLYSTRLAQRSYCKRRVRRNERCHEKLL